MGFEVVPASVPASAADRRQVMTAPASALPSLTEIQQAEVKQFSLKEDEYRRMRVLLRMTVLDRQRRQEPDSVSIWRPFSGLTTTPFFLPP